MQKKNAKAPVKSRLGKHGEAGPKARKANPFGLKSMADELVQWFQSQDENNEPLFKVLDMFPIPIQIFAPDGTEVFANRANLEFSNVKDPGLLIGKYNVLKDPVCNDELGMREGIQKAFRGEFHISPNFPVPIQDLVERGVIKEKPFESATMDYLLYPIWRNDTLHFVVCVYIVRNMYYGRPDIARAKEYIDAHWQGEYNAELMAKSVGMSVTQLYRVFKEHTGMTPGDYQKKVKVEHIKEKLADKNLSIKEAFAACGEDSRGWILRVFKKLTGKTPQQYRESLP